jgi:predicted nuclease of predicted toxin-antitoxin system
MKFLADHDVYALTVRFLRGLSHDVVPVAQIGLATADDEVFLKTAQKQGRIFVTRDRDYRSLVFVKALGVGCCISVCYPPINTWYSKNSKEY